MKGSEARLMPPALEMLKFLIRTSTTSMTSVPKPLKYLTPYYLQIKNAYDKMTDVNTKKLCADIISVLAMGPIAKENNKESTDCLKYCLLGLIESNVTPSCFWNCFNTINFRYTKMHRWLGAWICTSIRIGNCSTRLQNTRNWT